MVATQISGHGVDVVFDDIGQAYVVGVAELSDTGRRITATVDHDGDLLLRKRLAVYVSDAVHRR